MAKTYDNSIRDNSRLECVLQNGHNSPSFDCFQKHSRTMLSPTLQVTEEVTLKPGVVYNLDGLFLNKRIRNERTSWKKKSVTITLKKSDAYIFSGGVRID